MNSAKTARRETPRPSLAQLADRRCQRPRVLERVAPDGTAGGQAPVAAFNSGV